MTKAPKGEFAVQDRRPGFAIIDNELIDDYGSLLGAYGIAAYCILVRFANRQGTDAYPSYQTVGDLMGASRRTAIRAINNLIALGLIGKEKRDNKGEPQSNMYTILPVRKLQASQVVGSVPQSPPSDSRSPLGVPQSPPSDSQSPDQDTNNKTPITREGGESPVTRSGNPSPQPTLPPPPLPAANALIAAAEKVAEVESFDGPKPAVNETGHRRPQATKPPLLTPRRMLQRKGTHFDPALVEGDHIPTGKGQNAVQVYFERFSPYEYKLSEPQQDDMMAVATNLDLWREVVTAWDNAGFKGTNRKGMLDWYREPARFRDAPTYTNGHAKPAAAPASPSVRRRREFRQWLIDHYHTDQPKAVAKKLEELEREFDEWNQAQKRE